MLWNSALKLGRAISSVKESKKREEADATNFVRFVISSFGDAAERIALTTQTSTMRVEAATDELGIAVALCKATKQSNGIAQPESKKT